MDDVDSGSQFPPAEAQAALDVLRRCLSQEEVDPLWPGRQQVYGGWLTVWLMIRQRLTGGSLAHVVAELVGDLGQTLQPQAKRIRDGKLSPNNSAFCRARAALPDDVIEQVADRLFESLASASTSSAAASSTPPSSTAASSAPSSTAGSRWKGRPVYLLDGTLCDLPRSPSNAEEFSPGENQHGAAHFPQVLALVAHDAASGLALRPEIGAMFGPGRVSEKSLALRLLPRLPAEALVVGDQNFGIFALAYAAAEAHRDCLWRLTNQRFERLRRAARPLGDDQPGLFEIEWRPSRDDRRTTPDLPVDAVVRGRLASLVVTASDGTLVTLHLFTSCCHATAAELADCYGRRWRIEDDIKSLKRTLQLHRLRGTTARTARKELTVGVMAYNLVIETRRLAAQQAAVAPRELSFSRVKVLVEGFLPNLARQPLAGLEQEWARLLRCAATCKQPKRRSPRSFPREVIPKRKTYAERPRKSQ